MKVLIIGNGFEIDAGFETRYSDFVLSKEWQLLYQKFSPSFEVRDNLATFLYGKSKEEWFCLEESIKEYYNHKIQSKDDHFANEDVVFFNALKTSLENFLIVFGFPISAKEDSLADKFIEGLVKRHVFDKIYTFNYIHPIAIPSAYYNLSKPDELEYVHNYCTNHIILGINEPVEKPYDFLCKTYDPKYPHSSIKRVLSHSTDVVIYGHSLNIIDGEYFRDYLKSLSTYDEAIGKRYLTIISKDGDSIRNIKASIEVLDISLTDLQQYSQLTFISTDGYYNQDLRERDKVDELFSRLISNSNK